MGVNGQVVITLAGQLAKHTARIKPRERNVHYLRVNSAKPASTKHFVPEL